MNARFKGWLILLITVMWLSTAQAQNPSLYFSILNHTNGLSNNKVNCILQDKRGFTWIGTDDGLNRYDGHNFIVFKNIPGQPSSLSGNTIADMHEDKDGVLWIATEDGGITRYDYRLKPEEQFRQFKHNPGNNNSIPVNVVNDILEDKDGFLWLATGGAAVLRFDKKTERFVQPAGSAKWTIYDMCFDNEGMIWAGREGGSILKVNPKTLEAHIDQRYANVYATMPHVVVTSLFKDSRNNIWFGSWDNAVYRQNAATGQEESFSNQKEDPFSFGIDEALAFNEDKRGRIWIGGKHFGLYIYDNLSGSFYNYRHDPAREGTLSSNSLNCIFIDPSGVVWMGTNNGISIYQPSQQQFLQQFLPAFGQSSAEPLVINDFFHDDKSRLWIGTNKGLYIREADGNYNYKKLNYNGTDLKIGKFYKDNDGTMYLGTNYSLFRYNEANGTVSLLPNTEKDQVMMKIIESRIVSIVKDTIADHPVLLTAPYGHFFSYYDYSEEKWVSRKDSVKKILRYYNITDNLIRKIVKTKDGHWWMANAKNGLMEIVKDKPGSMHYINDPLNKGSITNNNVYDIKESTNGNLWVSTYGGGLNYFDRQQKTFQHVGSDNNLVEGIEIDKEGNVWSISNGNLQKFVPATSTFTYSELPDIEKTGGIKGYIYKDEQGKMYVAGAGYYIAFNPEQVIVQRTQPSVYLTDFRIFNQSFSHLLMEKEVTLGHTQNFFTIHFAAPFYAASAPVQYAYMLDGVDKDWINNGTSTQAPYTNLSAGEYLFKVRATVTPGTWSDKITTIRIRIIPPFWMRWWFSAMIVLMLCAIAYGIYRYRINELLKRQAIRNKIAQDLHDNVGSTLSSISVYSQVAKIFNERQKFNDLSNTLEKISVASGEMISEMSDTVWAINPRNDNMTTILQRMESFARPLLASKEINFNFNYNEPVKHVHLEMTIRKNFYLIFKEAVNNAVKYANCKNLDVSIQLQHQKIELTVKDDGQGFDAREMKFLLERSLSGNGLGNMKRRALEMKGDCTIESTPGQGTTVQLSFPVT